MEFLYVFKLLARVGCNSPTVESVHQDKIEIWELAPRLTVSCSSSATVSFQELQEPTYCTEEKSDILGMTNLTVGEPFSFVRLIISHLLPLNRRLQCFQDSRPYLFILLL